MQVILPPLLNAPWLIPRSDKPDTPIAVLLLPADRLLLGQRLSLPG